jgi:dipeptidyl-peptidase 4
MQSGPRRFWSVPPALVVFLSIAPPACRAEVPAPPDTFLHQYAATFRFRLGRPTSIQVTPSGDAVLYLRSGPRDFVQDLYAFDTRTGREQCLLTAEQILRGTLEKLSMAEKARRERMRLAARGIAGFQLSQDGGFVLVPLSGRLFVFERASGTVRELRSAEGGLDPQLSFDGTRVAFVREGDLWVTDLAGDSARRLTKHETPDVSFGDAEFVAQEEMGRFHGFWWSPDGTRIACQRTDVSGVEKFHIADPARPEQAPESWAYPRPGKANALVQLFLIPVGRGKRVEVAWDRARFPYLSHVVWEEHAPLCLLVQNREQTEETLLAVHETDGKIRTLLTERDDAWLNIDEAMPRWLEDGSGFLWTSEREGAWRLELHSPDGGYLRALTPLDFGYRGFGDVDARRGVVWALASADPTQTQLWCVPLDARAGPPQPETHEVGLHGAVFSKGHEVWVHTFDGIQGERLQIVMREDRTVLGPLPSTAETPAALPRVEFTTVDDSLGFHAAIIRPRAFHSRERYPVLVEVYGGPTAQMVQASAYRYLLDQWLADQGFVVVTLDGRGTPGRGRAWERILRGSFIDVPLADQVRGLEALGKRYPELDLSRAGIFGWSYGGYLSALAVMRRPDVFRAGVAGAPVTNWLDYDTHYTERYIGLPDAHPEAYKESSVLASAPLLQRPLLLIHGTDDDNVYFTHSIQLSNALYRAGKRFEFLPLVGFTHMVTDPLITEQLESRIADFFVRELGRPQPKEDARRSERRR